MANKITAKGKYTIEMDEDACCAFVVATLKDSLRIAELDYARSPTFMGKEGKDYIKAVKIVIDWFSTPDQWGKYK